MSTLSSSPPAPAPAVEGVPAWEIAYLFPNQGHWSEEEYLWLPGNRLVEFSAGSIEVLRMPTELHQAIVAFIYEALVQFVRAGDLGTVRFAPLPVRTVEGHYRMPDVQFLRTQNDAQRLQNHWQTADLVLEVVSADPKDRERDLVTKRKEYAQAHIPEYWIVDPQTRRIIVLKLNGDQYEEHGIFTDGQQATSPLLPNFSVDVTEVFSVK